MTPSKTQSEDEKASEEYMDIYHPYGGKCFHSAHHAFLSGIQHGRKAERERIYNLLLSHGYAADAEKFKKELDE